MRSYVLKKVTSAPDWDTIDALPIDNLQWTNPLAPTILEAATLTADRALAAVQALAAAQAVAATTSSMQKG